MPCFGSISYDQLDRITTSTVNQEEYTYDRQGNRLTLSSTADLDASASEYTYDKRDRLTAVSVNGAQVGYTYNGDNLLVERTENGKVTRYYYDDGAQIIAEAEVQNGTPTLKANYIRGGQLEAIQYADGSKAYVQSNGHGDITELRDAQGVLLNQYTYDIWGNILSKQEQVHNPFRYSGELWDDTTNLQYLRARWYDASIGRFIGEDKYEGRLEDSLSLNLYTYVTNNPLKYKDPTGHMAVATLNEFLEDYINGNYTQQELIDGVIRENGPRATYTAFHEITQILFATQIYDEAGSIGEIPQLEYKVTKGEVDIYYNDEIWEVKAKYSWNFHINWDAAWEDLEKKIKNMKSLTQN